MRETRLPLLTLLWTFPRGTRSLFRKDRRHSKSTSRSIDPSVSSRVSGKFGRGYNSDPYEVDVREELAKSLQSPAGNEPGSTTTEPSTSPSPLTESEPTVSNDNAFRAPSETPEPTTIITPETSGRICDLTAFGAFGSISRDRRQFDFYYQVETSSLVTQQIYSNELLGLVDKEIGAMLLPLLFQECRDHGRMLQANGADTCEVRGFSRLPFDRVMVGVSCVGPLEEPTNNCFVIDAGIRLHFDPDGDCSNVNEQIISDIRATIRSNDFTSIDPRIVRGTYLDASDINFDEEIKNISGGSENETKVPGYAMLIIAFAALVLIVPLLILIARRRKKSEEETNGRW